MKKIVCLLVPLMMNSLSVLAYDEGDYVCVKAFRDDHGYCGNIEKVTSKRLKIQISSQDCSGHGWFGVSECGSDECSGGARVDQNSIGQYVWAEKYCITSR